MNQVKEFDKRLKKTEDVSFLMAKVMTLIFGTFGCFLMLLPLTGSNINAMVENLALFPILLLGMAVLVYLSPYMHMNQNGKNVSIYKMLRFLPVERKEICQVRKEYLNKFIVKIGIISFTFQQIGAVLDHSWSVGNVCYPIIVIALAWGAGWIYIHIE